MKLGRVCSPSFINFNLWRNDQVLVHAYNDHNVTPSKLPNVPQIDYLSLQIKMTTWVIELPG